MESYEKNLNDNLLKIKNFIEDQFSQNKKDLIIFSQHALPAEIYFFLKKKKIDFIFPLKPQKLALLEKYIKSSLYYNNIKKSKTKE